MGIDDVFKAKKLKKKFKLLATFVSGGIVGFILGIIVTLLGTWIF